MISSSFSLFQHIVTKCLQWQDTVLGSDDTKYTPDNSALHIPEKVYLLEADN